jgi:hypothetical protein
VCLSPLLVCWKRAPTGLLHPLGALPAIVVVSVVQRVDLLVAVRMMGNKKPSPPSRRTRAKGRSWCHHRSPARGGPSPGMAEPVPERDNGREPQTATQKLSFHRLALGRLARRAGRDARSRCIALWQGQAGFGAFPVIVLAVCDNRMIAHSGTICQKRIASSILHAGPFLSMMRLTPGRRTMRYCGNCGVQLFEASLAQGRCLSCGAAITREGDIVSASEAEWIVTERWHEVEPDYRTTQLQRDLGGSTQASDSALAPLTPAPMLAVTHNPPASVTPATASALPVQSSPPAKRRLGFALLGAGLLGVIILAVLIFSLIGTPPTTRTTARIAATSSVGTSTSHKTPVTKQTPLPGTHATATPGGPPMATPQLGGTPTSVPTATASSTPIPTSTPIPSPTPIPTPTPGTPARITLSPTGSSGLICLNNTTNFYIINSGGSPLNWTVAVSQGSYTLAPPTSGTLASGAQQNITVSGISGSGQIQVSDPSAANSPQYFTITCTV